MAPTFQRREQHEPIGHAVAFVFVIVTLRVSRFGADRRARLDDQLLRGFVEAHEGARGIARPVTELRNIFHVGDKGRAGVGGITHCCRRRGLRLFLFGRSCCRWRVRQCAVRRPSPQAGEGSIARSHPGPETTPARSIWLPPHRRKSAAGRTWDCITGHRHATAFRLEVGLIAGRPRVRKGRRSGTDRRRATGSTGNRRASVKTS
jgi:hypothetical protein